MNKQLLPAFLMAVVACDSSDPPMACDLALPDYSVHVGEESSVAPCFTSGAPPLRYAAESRIPEVVSATLRDGLVILTGESVGEALVEITAMDVEGQTGTQHVRVLVPNRVPEVVGALPSGFPLGSVYRVLLTHLILDPDRQQLRYRLEQAGSAIKAEIDEDWLVITALSRGHGRLSLVGVDPELEEARWEGSVTVGDPIVYITQAAQSLQRETPLVGGRDGLFRLFLRTDSLAIRMPDVTARLVHADGRTIHSFKPVAEVETVPWDFNEGRLGESMTAHIDGMYIQPETRLEIDVANTPDPAMTQRIEMPLDVRELPPLEITLVPVVLGNDSSAIARVAKAVANGRADAMFRNMVLLPTSEYTVRGHAPLFMPNDYDAFERVPPELLVIRNLEGGRGYYMGVIPRILEFGVSGAAYVARPAGFSVAQPTTFAHELGHMVSLEHAPCGGAADPDRNYPYPRGRTGVWGYDFQNRRLVEPTRADMMGYCDPKWISDYSFGKALKYLSGQSRSAPVRRRVLMVWGWFELDGSVRLQPAFYANAVPRMPADGGAREVVVHGSDGEVLVSYRFDPLELVDGNEARSFVHMIPVSWHEPLLESIALDGEVRLDAQTNEPMSIVMRGGQVQAIVPGEINAPGAGDRVLFSRGIPR